MKKIIFIVVLLFAGIGFSITACQKSSKIIKQKWDFSNNKLPREWIPKGLSWNVENGVLVNDDKLSRADEFVFHQTDISDFYIEADIKIEKEYTGNKKSWAGFHVRSFLPFARTTWDGGYLIYMYPHGAVTALCMTTKQEAGTIFTPTSSNKFTKLAVKMKGSLMEIYVNSQNVLSFTNDADKIGGVSLINFGNKAIFDNIKLKAVIAKPSEGNYLSKKILKVKKSNSMNAVTPLPKITVKRGKNKTGYFVYKNNGKKFVPDGYNHTVGDITNVNIPHANFNVGTYNSEENEKILSEMEKLGANVIRVWLWGTNRDGTGIWGSYDSQSLNYKCLDNFCDFLRLATKHKIYVIPILDLPPNNKKYKSIIKKYEKNTDKKIVNHNSDILTKGCIEARKQAARDTVKYIKQKAPALLNTILAWSLYNEIYVVSDYFPFSLTNGKVRVANGKTYDMSDFNSRQKCADDSFYFWAKEIAGAIREIQPDALVTIGMWTSDAHKRKPINGIKVTEIKDPRFPPRPSVFAKPDSEIDFLDIHVYPWQNKFLINAEAHELDKLNRSGIPVLVGEYGVFIHQAKNNLDGAKKILELRKKCYDAGYAGTLLWVWSYKNGLYNGNLKEVRDALSAARKNNAN